MTTDILKMDSKEEELQIDSLSKEQKEGLLPVMEKLEGSDEDLEQAKGEGLGPSKEKRVPPGCLTYYKYHPWGATYNIMCAMAGVGVLGLPYALRQGGWGSLSMLIILGMVLLYTGLRMSRCLLYRDDVTTYAELGRKAFLGDDGTGNRRLATTVEYAVLISQMVNCVGSSILFLILAGQNMTLIFQDIDIPIKTYMWIIILVGAVLPLSFLRSMHEVSWTSFFGVITCVASIIIVIIENFVATNVERSHDFSGASFVGFLKASATMCFSYGGHVIFPAIVNSMRPKQQHRRFPNAVLFSYVVVIVMYIPISVSSYYMFGIKTQDNILKNLGNSVPVKITEAALTLHVLFAYIVFMMQVFEDVERKLRIHKITERIQQKKIQPTRCNQWCIRSAEFLARISIRTLIVAFTAVIAIIFPFFADLMSLIGGSAQAASILILPTLIYLRMFYSRMHRMEIIFAITVCVVGTAMGVSATIFAFKDIVTKVKEHGIRFDF